MGNSTSSVGNRILVVSRLMGPMTMKLKNSKHNAQESDTSLSGMLPTHEAQKFQAIKGVLRVNHPPELSDCPTIDHVNHTVVVSPADFA